jgi:hypothetical protein
MSFFYGAINKHVVVFGKCDWLKSTAVGPKESTIIGRNERNSRDVLLYARCKIQGIFPRGSSPGSKLDFSPIIFGHYARFQAEYFFENTDVSLKPPYLYNP